MTIGEVAKRSGINASAIRYYERISILPRSVRRNGRRTYDGSAVKRLAVVRFAKEAGFTLAEVRELFSDSTAAPSRRWQNLAARKLAEIDALMRACVRMRKAIRGTLKCRCGSLEECGGRMIARSSPVA